MLKKIILTAIFLISAFCSYSQSFEFSNSHVAIHVKDVSISANFYNKILGLKEMETPKGVSNTVRWFYLSDKTQIHLIQSTKLVKHPKGIHLSIATNHFDDFVAYLKGLNIPFENWQGEVSTSNMRGDNIEQIYFQDPDGYWIEVNDDVK